MDFVGGMKALGNGKGHRLRPSSCPLVRAAGERRNLGSGQRYSLSCREIASLAPKYGCCKCYENESVEKC